MEIIIIIIIIKAAGGCRMPESVAVACCATAWCVTACSGAVSGMLRAHMSDRHQPRTKCAVRVGDEVQICTTFVSQRKGRLRDALSGRLVGAAARREALAVRGRQQAQQRLAGVQRGRPVVGLDAGQRAPPLQRPFLDPGQLLR